MFVLRILSRWLPWSVCLSQFLFTKRIKLRYSPLSLPCKVFPSLSFLALNWTNIGGDTPCLLVVWGMRYPLKLREVWAKITHDRPCLTRMKFVKTIFNKADCVCLFQCLHSWARDIQLHPLLKLISRYLYGNSIKLYSDTIHYYSIHVHCTYVYSAPIQNKCRDFCLLLINPQ